MEATWQTCDWSCLHWETGPLLLSVYCWNNIKITSRVSTHSLLYSHEYMFPALFQSEIWMELIQIKLQGFSYNVLLQEVQTMHCNRKKTQESLNTIFWSRTDVLLKSKRYSKYVLLSFRKTKTKPKHREILHRQENILFLKLKPVILVPDPYWNHQEIIPLI